MTYDPAKLPGGADAGLARICAVDTVSGRWIIMPTTLDKANHTLTAQTSHLSLFPAGLLAAGDVLDDVLILPIPWKIGSGGPYDAAQLAITRLPAGASVRLYDILGERIFEGTSDAAGTLLWNGLNSSGRLAGSGVYYAVLELDGKKRRRRLVVIR